MKYLFIIILILCFFSCSLRFHDKKDVNDPEVETVLTNTDYSLEEKWDFMEYWMYNNIDYISDIDNQGKRDYQQSPYETYTTGQGDCEDKAYLFAYFFWKYSDLDIKFIKQIISSKKSHLACKYNAYKYAWIYEARENKYYGSANDFFSEYEKYKY